MSRTKQKASYWLHNKSCMIVVGRITAVSESERTISVGDVELRVRPKTLPRLIEAFQKKLRMRFVVPLEVVSAYEEEGQWFGQVPAWSLEQEARRRKKAG